MGNPTDIKCDVSHEKLPLYNVYLVKISVLKRAVIKIKYKLNGNGALSAQASK